MKIWERQKNESEKAFAAFKMFLDFGDERTQQKVAEKSNKDASLIHRWASDYNWQERARAWDNSLLELKRRNYAKRYNQFLDKQFKGNERIQELLLKVLEEKDIAKISWKSWTELYRSNCAEMIELAKSLGVATTTDNEIRINITAAEKDTGEN